jgi:hypothetical protein
MASTLIVQTSTGLAPPRQQTEIAWPIPTADDYRAYAEWAGLRVLALNDVTRSFREVCARWRGALIVWDLALLEQLPPDAFALSPATIAQLPPDAFALSPATIAQVVEWSSQGLIGQVRMVVERERGS